MSNDWFFEKFALIADAPGAVERMRGLILLYAVQARLVPPQADDAPVSTLVQDLREAKNAISRGSRNRETDFDCDGVENLPFEIPTHWTSARLCDIGQISGGHTPSKNNAKYWNGEIQWFTSKDIKSNELFESEIKITDNAVNSPGLQLYPSGCLFMVARSGILKRTFPVAINRVPAAVNQDLKVLRPFVKEMEKYLQLMLRGLTDFIISRLVKTGMTVQSLKYDEFANQVFPLPPLAEQKRIVAKVDELMSICDALESQQQERELRKSVLVRSSLSRFAEAPTPENLGYLFHKSYDIPPSELRKSILTLAVQGKLVPQDPNDEPARHIVKKLAITRMQYTPAKHVKNTAKLCDADDNRYIYDIPSSWTWCRFGDLVLDFRYGTSRKCDRNSGGVPVLRIPNIQNGRVDSTDLKFTSMPSAEFAELRLQADDILLVRSNGSEALVGKSAVVCPEDERFAYAGYLVRARLPKKEVFSKYLHVALSARVVRDQIEGPIRTTSGVKNINTKELSNLALPLPPLAEQHRIVTKVDQLMALVDELERQQDASRENASKLLDAIVQEMTNGGQGISATLES
jgi:type I restriction enzyme S subunit